MWVVWVVLSFWRENRFGVMGTISSPFSLEAAHSPEAGVAAVVARASFLPPCSGVRH